MMLPSLVWPQAFQSRSRSRSIWLALCLCTTAALAAAPDDKPADPSRAWVRATATQAFVYGYAANGMMQRLSAEVLDPATRRAPFNTYHHFTALSTPQQSPFRAPNNDTLYSTAWLDLRQEPAILTMPDTAGRYYTAHVMDLHSETLANLGQREHGTRAGTFAIVGPGWKGTLPKGVRAVVHSNTVFATILLRVYVANPQDVPKVTALQQGFGIASLSRFRAGQSGMAAVGPESQFQTYRPRSAADRFVMLDQILNTNPTVPGEAALIDQFAGINLGPGQAVQRLTPDATVLEEAYTDALQALRAAGLRSGRMVNGWRIQLQGIGRYGFDYLQRASVEDGGPLANVPQETVYPSAVTDAQGRMLHGGQGNTYKLRFDKSQLPPVNVFWSLSIYRLQDGMLVDNPIQRYSIGDRTPGLVWGSDGSLTLCVRHATPCADGSSNWLPAPDGPFYMALRLYGPKEDVIAGRWTPPAVERIAAPEPSP